jgi:hypothetical protein
MAKKIAPKMRAWLKYGYACRQALKIKPFKKIPGAQKKKLEACVMNKARAAGMKVAGKY